MATRLKVSAAHVPAQLARTVHRHPIVVSVIAVVMVVLSAVFALPPKIDPNILALLPQDEPMVQTFADVASTGGVNFVMVSLSGPEDTLESSSQQLAALLQAEPSVELALSSLPEDLEQHLRVTSLDPDAVRELTQRLDGALALGPAANPMVLGPLLDMAGLTERLSGGANTDSLLPTFGSESRILIKPEGSNLDPQGSIETVDAIDRVLQQASDLGLTVTAINGPHVAVAQGMKDAKSDFGWISLVSAAIVLVVLSFGLGSLRAAIVVFPPIIAASLIELWMYTTFVGPLNNYTSFGTAILLGLGIDIAVHLVACVREHLREVPLQTAIERAWDQTGPACITGAVTSAAGFLALCVSSFRGFSGLGIHLAMGLVVCLVCMFLLLPLLLPFAGLTPRPIIPVPKMSGRSARLPRVGLGVLVALTAIVGVYGMSDLEIEHDFTAVAREGRVYSKMAPDEQARMRETYPPIVVPIGADETPRTAAARIREATSGMDEVVTVISSDDLLPADQDVRIERLQALKARLSNPNARYLPAGLVQQLATLRTWDGVARTPSDLPAGLFDLFGGNRFVLVRVTGDLYDVRNSSALKTAFQPFAPLASSELFLQARLYELIVQDVPRIGALALFGVMLFVFIDVRSVRWTLAIGISLVSGMLWAGAGAALFDIHLNVANLVAVPILLGIGVDAVVHLAHRVRTDPSTWHAARTIAVAIGISTLTTLGSFLSLTMASSGGIRSFGRLVVVGLSAVVLVSCLMLTLLRVSWGAHGLEEGDAEGDTEPADGL